MLVKIQTNEQGEQLVNARELWEYLEKPYGQFNKWFESMKDYGFEENIDYILFGEKNPKLGRPRKDYVIKLDMAKELSMISKTKKGKEVRQFFIQCEKKLMITLENQVKKLEKANKKPKKDKRLEFMLGNIDSINFLSDEMHKKISTIDEILDSIYDLRVHIAMYGKQLEYYGEDIHDQTDKMRAPKGYKRSRRRKK